MKVHRSGQRRHRRDERLVPRGRGPRRSRWSTASPAPALETSYANAGEVSPGYSAPWAGPGVPVKAIKWLLMHHRPLVIRPHLDWRLVSLGPGDAAQLHRARATRSTRAAWCGWPNTAATA